MNLAIRDVHLENDRDELIQFFQENLTKDSNRARFDWLYVQNPYGKARAWISIDPDGRTVGVAAAFPRTVWVTGSERRAWVLGDFCISNRSRTLGPALQLQRACIGSLDSDLWYDFPSRSMMAVYKRIGILPIGESVRHARVLRIDRKVENLVPTKSVARAVSFAGNTLLRARTRPRVPAGLEVSQFDGKFGEEFDGLNSRVLKRHAVQGTRTSAFLNWRYKNDPLRDFLVVVAKSRSELVGYATAAIQEPDASVYDLQAIDEETIPVMLDYMSQLLLQKKVHTLSAPLMGDSSLLQSLKSAGFIPREASPVVALGVAPSNWLLMPGDRDS